MKHGAGIFVLVVLVLAGAGGLAGSPAGAGDPSEYRRAETEAEKTLDAILKFNIDNYMVMLDLRRGIPVAKKDADKVASMFTKELLAAWRKAEQELLDQNCGGKVIEGELCGLDYDPCACGQDVPEYYLYLTKQQDEANAVILTKWGNPPQSEPNAVYHLVKQNDRWKIAGVSCGEGMSFNISE